MVTMKCYYTLFSKTGLIKNIGSYILLFTNFVMMVSAILFYKCGYNFLEDHIQEIMNSKEEDNRNKDINKNETIHIEDNNNNKNPKNKKKKKKRKIEKTLQNNPTKKAKKKSNITNVDNTKNFSDIKLNFNFNPNDEPINGKNFNVNNINNKDNFIKYDDIELNYLSYNDALKYDKRTYISYYKLLIRIKHPLIFSFCPIKDYNSIIIKIDLFFISFCIYCFINALFFDEKTIHKIYEDKGIYNFIYLIPYISYSFLISHALFTIIKYVSLSERNIYEIKSEKTIEDTSDKIEKVKRCLVIKYILFFILSILFLLFFWYYLSSFAAVYQNTQIYLIKNILISFGLSLIYPFVINILPSFIRIYSLTSIKPFILFKNIFLL